MQCSSEAGHWTELTSGSYWQPPFYTPGQADFAHQSPASKNRIQGTGLLHPVIQLEGWLSFCDFSPAQASEEEFRRANQDRPTIQLSAQLKTACPLRLTLRVLIPHCSWGVLNPEEVSYHSDALRKGREFVLKK